MPSPRYWREVPSRFRLEAVRCRAVQQGELSRRARSVRRAAGTEFEKIKLTRKGKVVTSTVLSVAPDRVRDGDAVRRRDRRDARRARG